MREEITKQLMQSTTNLAYSNQYIIIEILILSIGWMVLELAYALTELAK